MLQRDLQYYSTCAETAPKWAEAGQSIFASQTKHGKRISAEIDFGEFGLFRGSLFIQLVRCPALPVQRGSYLGIFLFLRVSQRRFVVAVGPLWVGPAGE